MIPRRVTLAALASLSFVPTLAWGEGKSGIARWSDEQLVRCAGYWTAISGFKQTTSLTPRDDSLAYLFDELTEDWVRQLVPIVTMRVAYPETPGNIQRLVETEGQGMFEVLDRVLLVAKEYAEAAWAKTSIRGRLTKDDPIVFEAFKPDAEMCVRQINDLLAYQREVWAAQDAAAADADKSQDENH
ncbi:MAG: hypothetical protein AAGH68_15575 [Pseudomonadota bacterium]